MTTAIIIFVLIVVLIGVFFLGVYVGGYAGIHRSWDVFETTLENSDLTDLQRLEIVNKMGETIRIKKQ